MKIIFALILCCAFSSSSLGQSNWPNYKGSRNGKKVFRHYISDIKFYKYEYNPSVKNTNDSVNKIGQIVFWRSEDVYDRVAKKYWRPNISYDVYLLSDWTYIKKLSDSIILVSNCDSINKGGDIQIVGNYVLVNTSNCVNCASMWNRDYCRNKIKFVLESVPDKTALNFEGILKQFIISKGKFKG